MNKSDWYLIKNPPKKKGEFLCRLENKEQDLVYHEVGYWDGEVFNFLADRKHNIKQEDVKKKGEHRFITHFAGICKV